MDGAFLRGLFIGILGMQAHMLFANPAGENVVAGSASFDRNGSTLQITTSDRVIINWQDFSIGSGELTKFIQPGAGSAALNRVITGNPSAILGNMEANGQIYLINPNGILVGAGARIDTGSFIASTLDVSNEQFLGGGDLNFLGTSGAGIQNFGVVNALGGDVLLLARHVDNQGVLQAADGVVGMAAGREILLQHAGEERLTVRVKDSTPLPDSQGVVNAGTIMAAQVELKAHGNIYQFAINQGGLVRATGAVQKNGRVVLTADDGLIKNTGAIEAKNGMDGGEIQVVAKTIRSEGNLDASGKNGGSVSVQADIMNHTREARVDGVDGKGGNVRFQAKEQLLLTASGSISARGTEEGGKVEVSAGSQGTVYLSGKQGLRI